MPAALGLAALAVPLIVLYMLRSRPRRVEVSSLLLWQQVGPSVSSAVPWQRLRSSPLLWLQLLLLAVFVAALARPFTLEETLLGPHTVFLIDTSGSMAMAGRFEAAVDRAEELAADVSASHLVSVVDAGPNPRVVVAFSQDPGEVGRAVEGLSITGGVERLDEALRLARGLATPDHPTTNVIFSDGGPAASSPFAEPLAGVEHLRFDARQDNLAITAFSTDPSTEGTRRAFLEVANVSGRPHRATVEVAVDGLSVGIEEIDLDPNGRRRLTLPIEAGPGDRVRARLLAEPDGLVLDDQAELVIGRNPRRRVALLGDPSIFVETLVAAVPGFELVTEEPDLMIVDGGPLPPIDRPAWIIRTAQVPTGLAVEELVQNAVVTYQRPGDPLLDDVDLSELAVGEAQVVTAPEWLPLVRAGEVPLILLGEVNGHRVVYFPFDLTHSNLPVQVAFPVLGSRLLEWLAGVSTEAGAVEEAGTPIPLAIPPGGEAVITLPDGSTRRLASTATAFVDTGRPGLYHVAYLEDDGAAAGDMVVGRRFAPSESMGEASNIATGDGPAGEGERATLIREWGPWLVGALLLLSLTEWWIGHQRPLPRREATT